MGYCFSWIPAVEGDQLSCHRSRRTVPTTRTENLLCAFRPSWVSDPPPHTGGLGPAAPPAEGKHHLSKGCSTTDQSADSALEQSLSNPTLATVTGERNLRPTIICIVFKYYCQNYTMSSCQWAATIYKIIGIANIISTLNIMSLQTNILVAL